MMLARLILGLVLVTSAVAPARPKTIIQPAGLGEWVKAHLRKEYDGIPTSKELQYDYVAVDLNRDKRAEVLVYVAGPACGTGGCGIKVIEQTDSGWRLVTETSIGWSPVRILRTSTNGWRDLGVVVAGGGVTKSYEVRLRFNGKSYPTNPSVAPAEPTGAGTAGVIAIQSAEKPVF